MSDSTIITDKWGTKRWENSSGHHHRTDGPAIEWEDGSKAWCINGRLHRLDGPAFEYLDGHKSWYVNDEFLGDNNEGFWALWDILTLEQKENPTLLSYLPGDFNV